MPACLWVYLFPNKVVEVCDLIGGLAIGFELPDS